MLIRNASDVTVYGLKEEGPRSTAIIDSDRICVYGYGGIASAKPGQFLFLVERTPNVRLVGLVDRVNIEGSPPTEWRMVTENPLNGPAVNTRPLDRIILYQRGFEGP